MRHYQWTRPDIRLGDVVRMWDGRAIAVERFSNRPGDGPWAATVEGASVPGGGAAWAYCDDVQSAARPPGR
jgi:hypothetical protein